MHINKFVVYSIFLVPGRGGGEDAQGKSGIVCSILNSVFLVPGRGRGIDKRIVI